MSDSGDMTTAPVQFATYSCPETQAVKDESNMLWGVVVHPLARPAHFLSRPAQRTLASTAPPPVEEIARCGACGAYINPYCNVQYRWWQCALCRHHNPMVSAGIRYSGGSSSTEQVLELNEAFVEFDMPAAQLGLAELPDELEEDGVHDDEAALARQAWAEAGSVAPLVYVAVVDTTGDEEYIREVTDALQAAVEEALHEEARFALVTYSDRIGLYDLSASFPHVQHVRILASTPTEAGDHDNHEAATGATNTTTGEDAEGECVVGLREVTSLQELAVPVGPNRGNIAAALQSIRSTGAVDARRGLGPTIASLCDMLEAQGCGAMRAMVFLAGKPSFGQGTVDENGYSTPEDFYQQMGYRMGPQGMCVDVFALREQSGLVALAPMVEMTGGTIHQVLDPPGALAQLLFRHLDQPIATNCLLRLRTTPELSVAPGGYGSMLADVAIDNLWHMAGCTTYSTVALDFEFEHASGFTADADAVPYVQLVFAYSIQVVRDGHLVTLRRVRVMTTQIDIADRPSVMWTCTDPDATLQLLAHKAIRVAKLDSEEDARDVVRNWLLSLLRKLGKGAKGCQVDNLLQPYTSLSQLVFFTYGLLHSEALCDLSDVVSSDRRAYIRHLLQTLEPRLARKLCYPDLLAFSDVNTVADSCLRLSRHATVSSGQHVFLADRATQIIVYYGAGASAEFPPPTDSLLGRSVTARKDEVPIVPKIVKARHGSVDALLFDSCLIEDAPHHELCFRSFVEGLERELAQ